MSNEMMRYSEETFERVKHVNEYGYEFWYARELQSVLEYTEWRNFQKLIEKAQTACENSDMAVEECFVEVNKHHPCRTAVLRGLMTTCFPATPARCRCRWRTE